MARSNAFDMPRISVHIFPMKDYASIAAIVLRLRKSDRLLPTESVPYPMGTNSLVGAVVTNADAALRWLDFASRAPRHPRPHRSTTAAAMSALPKMNLQRAAAYVNLPKKC
jgi:hypothetical protein